MNSRNLFKTSLKTVSKLNKTAYSKRKYKTWRKNQQGNINIEKEPKRTTINERNGQFLKINPRKNQNTRSGRRINFRNREKQLK